MSKSQKVFKAVEAARAKNPQLSVSAICKAKKWNPALYYNVRRQVAVKGKAKAAPKVKYQKLRAARPAKVAPVQSDKMIFVMGSADQIRDVMGAL